MKYIFLIIFIPQIVLASSINAILKNNQALKELNQDKKLEANKILSDTLVDYPNEAALSYNLGQTFEINEEKEKAAQAYAAAAKNADNEELKFKSSFNAGRVLGELKKRDEAVRYYQAALDINPESVEAKTNIELLFQNNGGGGGGENQNQKQDQEGKDKKQDGKDGNDNKDKQPQDQNKDQQKPKPKPRPFDSKELSQQDVNRITEELKRQEEGIRAKFNEKYRKETPVDKDW